MTISITCATCVIIYLIPIFCSRFKRLIWFIAWQKSGCPLNQNCLSECLAYNIVLNTSTTKHSCGASEKSFKETKSNNASLFRHKSRQKSTELSNHIWKLKENGENHTIDWLIAMKAHPHICGTRKCDLCLCETLLITRANLAVLLDNLFKISVVTWIRLHWSVWRRDRMLFSWYCF